MTIVPEGAAAIIGSHYRAPDYFLVGREKIREFAAAVKDDHPTHFNEVDAEAAGYPEVVAPLTFLAIAGRLVPRLCQKLAELPLPFGQQHLQQLFTVLEMPIEAALGHPQIACQLRHPHRLHAAVQQGEPGGPQPLVPSQGVFLFSIPQSIFDHSV